MRAEVEEATALNDLGRAERAREEMEVLMQQLAGAIGLGNRDRKIPSNAERSRVAVTKAVTLALRTIGEADPSLRRYLAGTIKTGQFDLRRRPAVPGPWRARVKGLLFTEFLEFAEPGLWCRRHGAWSPPAGGRP